MTVAIHLKRCGLTAIACLFVSLYLVREHFSEEPSFCDLSAYISCSVVNKSEYAKLFNVPIAIFGVMWNVVMASAVLVVYNLLPNAQERDLANDFVCMMLLWAIAGGFFVIYLLGAELILGAICPLCTIIHVCVLYMLYLTIRIFREMKTAFPSPIRFIETVAVPVLLVVLINLFLILLFTIQARHPDAPTPHELKIVDYNPEQIHRYRACFIGVKHKLTFFGLSGCGHCQMQKTVLGPLLTDIHYVECEYSCRSEHNINAIPTWIMADQGVEVRRESGILSAEELYQFVECANPLA